MKTKITFILCVALIVAIMPLSAAKYYLYTGSTNPWGTPADATAVTQVSDISTTLNGYATNDVVWIAAGTYTISAAIAPKTGMQIYGGFVGTESVLTDRIVLDADGNGVKEPWEFSNPTVINGSGFSGTSVAYSVFNSSTAAYTLNGVTIDGHKTSYTTGGGIYTNGLSFITNCIVRNINHTGTNGGAIFSNGTGGATITGCLIENCVSSGNGAGICANRKITVKQCIIRNNYVSGVSSKGGGIYLGNTADASNTTNVVNNAIYNNTALQGGAIYIADVSATVNIINNTIVNNYATAGNGNGGIIGIALGQKIYNNVLYNNLENGTNVRNLRGSGTGTLDIQYCAYNAGEYPVTGTVYGTVANITDLSTPDFVQPSTTTGYTAPMPTDVKIANFAISSTSALKDMGALSSTLSVVPAIDLLGKTRPDKSTGDIGAYEYGASLATSWSSVNFKDNSIFVYKNHSNQIEITIPTEIVGKASISIFNTTGQKLENKYLTSEATALNNSFSAGVYLVSMLVNGKTTTRKVVIN
jgi:fructose-specific component phosphotransferase system IIB-like protein